MTEGICMWCRKKLIRKGDNVPFKCREHANISTEDELAEFVRKQLLRFLKKHVVLADWTEEFLDQARKENKRLNRIINLFYLTHSPHFLGQWLTGQQRRMK